MSCLHFLALKDWDIGSLDGLLVRTVASRIIRDIIDNQHLQLAPNLIFYWLASMNTYLEANHSSCILVWRPPVSHHAISIDHIPIHVACYRSAIMMTAISFSCCMSVKWIVAVAFERMGCYTFNVRKEEWRTAGREELSVAF